MKITWLSTASILIEDKQIPLKIIFERIIQLLILFILMMLNNRREF